MKRIINGIAVSLVSALALISCSDKYSISGTSLQMSGANMAFLRNSDDAKTVDSCEIVHGKFSMSGILDSVECASIVLGNMNAPLILEQGNIKVSFENASLQVSGTPLNDKLYLFLNSRDSLTMLLRELPSKESKMILNGVSEDERFRILGEEEAELRQQIDVKDTEFISNNFDNILGITWFLNLCGQESMRFGFPTTSPMLDELYGKAPDSFRNNKGIVEFMNKVNGK